MQRPRYSMSFTSGALLYRASLVIAELYAQLADWQAVRDRVLAGNLLQMRTNNASIRVCREVISRLKLLTPAELELLLGGLPDDQRYLLWLALCKRYRFIYDFAVEVIYENFCAWTCSLNRPSMIAFLTARQNGTPRWKTWRRKRARHNARCCCKQCVKQA